MELNMDDVINGAKALQGMSADELELIGLHREIQNLSLDWYADFIIGIYIGLYV